MDIHLSDCQLGLCLAKPLIRRQLKERPPISDLSALRFLTGRVVERALAVELKPITYDGIIATVDDLHPDYGYGEIKSTDSSLSKFSPETMYRHWFSRISAYCRVLDITSFNLIVVFMRGDYKGIRKGIKAWTLEFTPEEIEQNWMAIKERQARLLVALKDKTDLPQDCVTPATWECNPESCELWAYCTYRNGKSVFDEKGE
jgi:hypothetical protein